MLLSRRNTRPQESTLLGVSEIVCLYAFRSLERFVWVLSTHDQVFREYPSQKDTTEVKVIG